VDTDYIVEQEIDLDNWEYMDYYDYMEHFVAS
jgi:hypothetical protein